MKTRVLVVDDSSVMRHLITDIIQEDQELTVIDTARNGLEAVLKAEDQKPDVIVLDLHMGEYDGYYAVKEIMWHNPIPILILSAMGNSDFTPVHECLEAGAVDFINKPQKNNTALRDINHQIIRKVKTVAKARIRKVRKKKRIENTHNHVFDSNNLYELIVIGSSTGGPSAIETIVPQLPANLKIPIVIAQHMPQNFIDSFVTRLDNLTPIEVTMAKTGDEIEENHIYVAPGDRNLIVRFNGRNKKVFGITTKRFREYNHPSVDALFLSAAAMFKNKCIGVILTGMGKDGTEGMRAISKSKGLTIVQDKSTSVVYGMPKEAKEKGEAKHQMPVKDIAPFIVSALS